MAKRRNVVYRVDRCDRIAFLPKIRQALFRVLNLHCLDAIALDAINGGKNEASPVADPIRKRAPDLFYAPERYRCARRYARLKSQANGVSKAGKAKREYRTAPGYRGRNRSLRARCRSKNRCTSAAPASRIHPHATPASTGPRTARHRRLAGLKDAPIPANPIWWKKTHAPPHRDDCKKRIRSTVRRIPPAAD